MAPEQIWTPGKDVEPINIGLTFLNCTNGRELQRYGKQILLITVYSLLLKMKK